MRHIRYQISYGEFCDVVKKYDNTWGQYANILEKSRKKRETEYQTLLSHKDFDVDKKSLPLAWSIIHADF